METSTLTKGWLVTPVHMRTRTTLPTGGCGWLRLGSGAGARSPISGHLGLPASGGIEVTFGRAMGGEATRAAVGAAMGWAAPIALETATVASVARVPAMSPSADFGEAAAEIALDFGAALAVGRAATPGDVEASRAAVAADAADGCEKWRRSASRRETTGGHGSCCDQRFEGTRKGIESGRDLNWHETCLVRPT